MKIKIELGDATLETIIQETNPDLTKYNKIMCATAKVMTALCSTRIHEEKRQRRGETNHCGNRR